jgi:hypothetical protein
VKGCGRRTEECALCFIECVKIKLCAEVLDYVYFYQRNEIKKSN